MNWIFGVFLLQNVEEMYALAEKIVGGMAIENIGKRQSAEIDE